MPFFEFLSPKEVKEGNHIVKTPLTVRANASIGDINRAIESHVNVSSDKSSLNLILYKLYIQSKTENTIIYACGNKLEPELFVTELFFSQNEDKVTANFKILSHYQQGDAVSQFGLMKQLRNEIKSAFLSFDSSVILSE